MVEAGTVALPGKPAPTHAISFFDRAFGGSISAPPPPRPRAAQRDPARGSTLTQHRRSRRPVLGSRGRPWATRVTGPAGDASLPIAPTAIVATVKLPPAPRRGNDHGGLAEERRGGGTRYAAGACLRAAFRDTPVAWRDPPGEADRTAGVPIPQANPLGRGRDNMLVRLQSPG